MTADPAIAAWERAAAKTSPLDAIAAAREALAPLRDLHRPAREGAWTVCAHCSAGGSFVRWPCATAELVYREDEL